MLTNRTTSISKHLTGTYLFTITEGNRLTAIRLRNCFNEITGNCSSNQKGQIRMDNPAKLTRLGTQDEDKQKLQHYMCWTPRIQTQIS